MEDDGMIRELVTVDGKGLVTMFDNDTKGVAPFILAAIELDR
jgi:hypothetical protein